MSAGARPAGSTRLCPHCGAVILRTAAVCPSCRKHLRYAPTADVQPQFVPLRVAGSLRHPVASGLEPWEYAVTVTITDGDGKEVARQIVGVGALAPGDERTFTFAVEVFTPAGMAEAALAAERDRH